MKRIRKFINRLLGRHSQKTSSAGRNPWAGLSSYSDPETIDNPLKFIGREEETVSVYSLIDNNLLVTLYGKSGIGKTSLLNAGVFPMLREHDYFPISLRLGLDKTGDNYSNIIIDAIESEIKKTFGDKSITTIDIIETENDSDSDSYLWNYFARHKFIDNSGKSIIPVIILDQFEEAIATKRDNCLTLLNQISYLNDKSNAIKSYDVIEQDYSYEYNFRFLISIREDDLYRLEDIISRNYLSSLKQCRYRLHNLTKDSARKVVLDNGGNYIDETTKEKISERLIEASTNRKDGQISTNTLSLVCARLYDRVSQKANGKITLSDVNEYLATDPFDEYYTEAVSNLSEREKRYIEKELITSDGRRNMVGENEIASTIKSYQNLLNGKTKILHKIEATDKDDDKIELIHDQICPVVQKYKSMRLEKKSRTIFALSLLIVGALCLWMLNKTIVNDIVTDFLIVSGIGKTPFIIGLIASLCQFIGVLIFPLALGSIVYDLRYKKSIACVLLIVLIAPIIIDFGALPNVPGHPGFISKIKVLCFNIHIGDWNAVRSLLTTRRAIVSVVYFLISIVLISANIRTRRLKRERNASIGFLFSDYRIYIYYFVIAAYLFYKSIWNSGNFIVESGDSAWGLIVIPVITLFLTGFRFNGRKSIIQFTAYSLILISLFVICGIELNVLDIKICIMTSAFILLLYVFYNRKILSTFVKATANIIVLGVVLFLNLGYNPLAIKDSSVEKVYPWQIVLFTENNKCGVLNAGGSDTLIIPEFRINNMGSNVILESDVFSNNLLNIMDSSTYIEWNPYSIKLDKDGNDKFRLTINVFSNLESALYRLSTMKPSVTRPWTIENDGAILYLKLRNDIISYCLSGNDAILIDDVSKIGEFEELQSCDLASTLEILKHNNDTMTADEVTIFLKSLTRCIYMSILKESILRKKYSQYMSLFSGYYLPSIITESLSNLNLTTVNLMHLQWNLTYNLDLSGVSHKTNVSDAYKDNGDVVLEINSGLLSHNYLYAWNNLMSALLSKEYETHTFSYQIDIEKAITDRTNNMKSQLNQLDSILSNEKNSYATNILSDIENVTKQLEQGGTLGTDSAIQQIAKNIYTSTNKLKHKVSDNVKSKIRDLSSYTITLEQIQADLQFERMITTVLKDLYEIIKSNRFNPYNGFLISVCDHLYSVGTFRAYDMSRYKATMDSISKYRYMPHYILIRKVEAGLDSTEYLNSSLDTLRPNQQIL